MFREKLLIAATFASVLAVVLVMPVFRHSAFQSAAGETPFDGAAASLPDGGASAGEFRGLWLQLHANDPKLPFDQYVREIAATGANTVCFSVAAYQENASSSVIFVDQRKAPSAERIGELFDLAHELGLEVVFMPIVLLERPGTGEWRGKINPSDWNAWWRYYGDFIVEYAMLAQRHDVEMFLVGSELVSTERDEEHWRGVIRRVRDACAAELDASFREHLRAEALAATQPSDAAAWLRARYGVEDLDGLAYSKTPAEQVTPSLREAYEAFAAPRRTRLSYSANWDHYHVVQYWDALDAVGMTSYYNINPSERANPPVEALREAWEPIRDDIRRWQRQVGKPVLFTEVGWASQEGCSIEPWNYYRSTQVALAEQQACMQSFLDVFGDEPYVAGILIWKWRDYPGAGGPEDYGYTPYGKPVLETIQAYFRDAAAAAAQRHPAAPPPDAAAPDAADRSARGAPAAEPPVE